MHRILLACSAAGVLLAANAACAASTQHSLIPPSVQPGIPPQPAPSAGAGAAGQAAATGTAAGQPPQPGAPTQPGQPAAPGQAAQAAPAGQPAHLSHADQSFVAAATQSSTLQLQDAQLATQKAASPRVKQLAQRLVTDQTAASDALQQIAQQDNLTLPAQPSPLQAAQSRRLTTKFGADFDRAFLNAEVMHDQQAIGLYQREAQSSRDPTLKDFAQQTLAALRQHLALARSIDRETAATGSAWQGQD